jgi:hypothetical protein
MIFLFFIAIVFLLCESESTESESTLAVYMLNSGTGLRVGTAVASISPENETGLNMEGFEPRLSIGIHDTLSSRCIIIADDSNIVALIALDLIGIKKDQINELKAEINQSTGLKKENIFIHAIHTHSGPSMMDDKVNRNFLSSVYQNTKEATVQALKTIENVKAIVKSGISDVKTVNRRNPLRSVENEFYILEFQNKAKQNVASILNFGCHPVVLGPNNYKLSADYVHYLRNAVENELGGIAIFLNGSSGNINPARNREGNPYDRSEGTFEMAKAFGEDLANDMLHNYSKYDTASVTIRAVSKQVGYSSQYTFISILDLGIIQMAMVPGEAFESFGESIQELLPGSYKLLISMTNDFIGYIVPEDEWENCTNSFKPECYEETVGGGKEISSLLKEEFRSLTGELF